jgi:hypothetical protein
VAQRSFFGTIRLALLLVVLAFVALGAWLDRRRSTDWDGTLRVTVYPLAADDDAATREFLADLDEGDFDDLEEFFAEESARYGVALEQPVRVRVSIAASKLPPFPDAGAGVIGVAAWSLRFRYWAWRVAMNDPLPTPDIQVFAIYHAPDGGTALPDSLGLRKGLMSIAHLYADRDAEGGNLVVMAHELLHTLGATDKYDRATLQPQEPDGLGEPDRSPRFPQDYAEVMAGRIAVSAREAAMPEDLSQVLVGDATAREIGWRR